MDTQLLGSFYDHTTGETIVRELTANEIAQIPNPDEYPPSVPPNEQ